MNNQAIHTYDPGRVETYPQPDNTVFQTHYSGATDEEVAAENRGEKPQTPTYDQAYIPPDGGAVAWLHVFASFCIYFAVWGLIQSFGVFQSYYTLVLFPDHSASAISWIGATQAFLLVAGGILYGPLYDMGYIVHLNVVGTVLTILGLMMTSLCTQFYQAVLAQGLMVGIGCGCLYTTAMTVVASYFSTKRALAMGIASMGSGIGGTIISIMFRQLEPNLGFGWAVRTIAFVLLALLVFATVVMRSPVPPTERRRLFGFYLLKKPVFFLLTFGSLLVFVGLYVPLFDIQLFAQLKLQTSESLTFYLVPIMNSGSVVGRFVLSALAAKYGALNVNFVNLLMMGVVCFAWIAVKDVGGAIALSWFYGYFSGAASALAPIIIAQLTADPKEMGTRIGTMIGVSSLGVLAGSPAAGALVNLETLDFLRAQVFAGSVLVASSLLILASLILNRGAMRTVE